MDIRRKRRDRAHMTIALRGYCLFLTFSAFAYPFWFNLIGVVGAMTLSIATTVISVAIGIAGRRKLHGDRWTVARLTPVLLYLGAAAVSLVWSDWPLTTLLTVIVQASFVVQALFLARVNTDEELLRLVEIATTAVVVLSVAIESAIAIVGTPLLPVFIDGPVGDDPHIYWVRGNLFEGFLTGGRIQGIVGNSNLLATICVVALVVLTFRLLTTRQMIAPRSVAILLALWLLIRASSAAMFVAVLALAALALVVLLRRRLVTQREQRWFAIVTTAATALVTAVLLLGRDLLFSSLGRSDSLTGRTEIWEAVWERAVGSPLIGHGYASPWIPWDPAFSGWIIDHELTVFYAHNMWLDVFLQLGILGVVLIALLYGTALIRSWRLAVAPGTTLSALIPLLLIALLLIQGLTESVPIMYWGLGMVCAIATRKTPARTLTREGR